MNYRKANGLDEFYSRMKENGDVELFVGKYGDPTIDYPHIHVVHHGNGKVTIVASVKDGDHPWRTVLNDPDSYEVENAISEAASYL